MSWYQKPTTWTERLAQAAFFLALFAALWFALRLLAPVLAPVLLALLIAYVLDPLVDWFEERSVPRSVAIVVIAAGAIGGLAALFIVIVPAISSELRDAVVGLPDDLSTYYETLSTLAAERFGIDLDASLRKASSELAEAAQRAVAAVASAALDSVTTIVNAVLVPVFTFYYLRDFDTLKKLPLKVIPPRFHARILDRSRKMDDIVGEWMRGQIEVALVLALLYAIGYSIVGLKLAVAIGLVAGLLSVVPYLGGGIGLGLALLMALIHGGTPQLVGSIVVYVIVQAVEQYVVTPKLVGDKVGMSPVTVMVVLLVGGSLFGFMGVLIAIPAAAAGSVVAKDVFAFYRSSSIYTGDEETESARRVDDASDDASGDDTAAPST